MEYLVETRGELMKLRFELMTFGSNTLLNHHLFQKFKLIGRDKFNHLINILSALNSSSTKIFGSSYVHLSYVVSQSYVKFN
jgi:hypothetical protein